MILVVAEHRAGHLSRVTWEAIAGAQQLAADQPVVVCVLGVSAGALASVVTEVAQAAVREVVTVESPALGEYTSDGFTMALHKAIEELQPSHVVLPHTYQTRDFAPRLAARLNRALVTDVVGIKVVGSDTTFARPMFQGKLTADVVLTGPAPHFVSIQIGAFRADSASRGSSLAPARALPVVVDAGAIRQKPEPPFQEAAQTVDLSQAVRIVSVGRGIKGPEHLPLVQQLAQQLGAEIAASRPICDAGWLPMERQVGSSGQTVTPKLYLALGISGAIQHVVGMKGSGTIVAVNKDPDAPIFELADYGIVGDLFEIVPAIIDALKSVSATFVLSLLVLAFAGAFAVQLTSRIRLIARAKNTFTLDHLGDRITRLFVDVIGQRRTIAERPVVGLAHAFVFWGFLAFAGYSTAELLYGLGIVDVTKTSWFYGYRVALTPFASAVLAGILLLLARRVFMRPVALGTAVSVESVVISLFIVTLMVTYLLTWWLDEASRAGQVNWWTHMVVILAFLALIPASKHFHLVLSPITVFLKSSELGAVPNLNFEKEEVGLETVKDLGSKSVLDALTCVECGRCTVNCPAWGAGKELNPKTIILQTQDALLAGERDRKLGELYTEQALWQCTTCGACENQCPVGIEHVPILIGARRGLVSNGEAPAYLGGMYNNLERRSNIWGLGYDQRQKFIDQTGVEIFDPVKHDVLVWLGCAGAFEADFQKSLKSLFEILRARDVRFGVLAKERCTGDPAKRTGNEYMFQELATGNISELKAAGAKKILTSCPHCVKTIGDDYRRFGYEVEIVHSAVFVEELTRGLTAKPTGGTVTYHDPCYLGRYGKTVDEPRDLLTRFGATVAEPVRNRENPYCCGAGGGLLFADREEEPGDRISDVRFKQLRETGAGTVVTACPFCTIMLKGAGASAPANDVQFVDLMTYVKDRL